MSDISERVSTRIYGIGYYDQESEGYWRGYLEWNKLVPVLIGCNEIRRVVSILERDEGARYIRGEGYMINGVLIRNPLDNMRTESAGVLIFQSDLRTNIEQVIKQFELPIPESFTRREFDLRRQL